MKEKLTTYRCHSLKGAMKLFNMFQDMKLDNLDREQFFNVYDKCRDNVAFCVRFNRWQVVAIDCDLFETEIVDME